MASSQIGIASSSSSFGHVLRDDDLSDRWSNRESKAAAFQNLKDFVDSVSGQPKKKSANGLSQNDVEKKNDKQIDQAELWVHIPTYKVKENNNDVPESSKCDDRLVKKKEMNFSVSPVEMNGGVSSLVRRWKDFEAETNNSDNNSLISSSIATSLDTNNNISEGCDNESSVDMRSETRSNTEDTSGDSESEKEITRVVDIIRRLTSTAGINEENSNVNESYSPLCVSPRMGSRRFRGRQALRDLHMDMQTDRHNELQGLVETNAVSKFSKEGPIQAMLRVHVLRVGTMDGKDSQTSNSTSLEVNQLPESSIKQLRERFKPVSQHSVPGWKKPKTEVGDSSQVEKCTSVQGREDTHQQEVVVSTSIPKREEENTKSKESLSKSCMVKIAAVSNDKNMKAEEKNMIHEDSSENVHKEACSRSDILQEKTNEENISCSLRLSVGTLFSSTAVNEVCSTEEDEKRMQPSGISHEMSYSVDLQENQQPNENLDHRREESVSTQRDWEEECSNNHHLSESEHSWVSDVSHTQAGWEDWIYDVSRPRSEWEGLRKERYQEMLDPFRQKEDIRCLLESKSVSSFLSSGLRESIDRLMISRTRPELSNTGSQADEQVAEEEIEYKVEQEHGVQEDVIEETEGGNAGYDQDDEDENHVEQQYEEPVEYKDQTLSSLPFTSRNRNHGLETSACFDQVGFSPLQQDSSQNSYYQESRSCSTTTNTCSNKMQLIYEMRGHMEQLHQEMSEIRKSIKSCMNKQLKLQRSVEHDVVATLSHSGGQSRGRHSTQKKGLINKSMCCICYDVQVDSLLYRCGHMCTCFKCGHELQRGTGRCPVCEAPIIDVVRTHANS